jgi:excisionase family DNA binding protein
MGISNDKSMLAAIRAMVGQLDEGKMRDTLEAVLRGDKPKQEEDKIRQEVVSGEEAARMLNCTRRTVQGLAKRGTIRRAVFPGRVRGFGYTRASVEALVAGGAA